GTVFLDEIGDLSVEIQAKLLRVLQEKAFERVGGTNTIRVDVRIIAATNRNLEKRVKTGLFREDLYYRLNVVEIWLPPLRERKSDIPLLVDYFVGICDRNFNKRVTGLARPVLDVFYTYDWPGNIRELRNVCERAVLMAQGPVVTLESIPEYILRAVRGKRQEQQTEPLLEEELAGFLPGQEVLPLKEMVARLERAAIIQALKEYKGNKSAAAQALHLNRTTLYAKMRELGILKENA
ncbi:MAG: sigma 54-interacting transcriptional regulator, partial [Thermoanaerobacteraceae bacterium]|nr:sigma 54-interacting transcriptional regulator [Thermoanaerobacteraceae bacterium]